MSASSSIFGKIFNKKNDEKRGSTIFYNFLLMISVFIGTPQMNFFPAKLVESGKSGVAVEFGTHQIKLSKPMQERLIGAKEDYIGKEVILGVRPDDIHDEQIFIESSPDTVIEGYVDVLEKLGSENLLYLNIDGKEGYTIARVDPRSSVQVNTTVKFAIDVKHIHIFDAETQQTMLAMDDAAEKR